MSSISLSNVSVSFPIYGRSAHSLRHLLVQGVTGGRIGADAGGTTVVNALSNVTLTIGHGERVALIGHNGAGKTTLLRVLAGIYPPQTGRLSVEGHVAPLFDINLGMDPDATGIENIRLRGIYLGLSRREAEARVEEVAAFAGLGAFLSMPIRTYSAGMQTRLAFAVSTSVNPDILLLDEGIGAGDAAFVEKASERLQAFVARSGILVLASHARNLLSRFCDRAICLEHGSVIDDGPAEEVMDRYERRVAAAAAAPAA